jgi:hypothetical protein
MTLIDTLVKAALDALTEAAKTEGAKLLDKTIDEAGDWLRGRLQQDPGVVNAGRLVVEEVASLGAVPASGKSPHVDLDDI